MVETRVIRMHETGGPDVLRSEMRDLPAPGPGEIQVRQVAAGLNFIDTYHRSGLYPVKLPFIPGQEGAGVIEAVGEDVACLEPGDRVAYLAGACYAERVVLPASRALRLPDSISFDAAASIVLKGLTAWMLLFEIRPARAGETALVWAPAGGVGSLLVPWATSLGVRVIAVTSSETKAQRAYELGAAHVIRSDEDVASRVRGLTDGEGVDVSYDSVGLKSAAASLSSLKPRGWWISYGNASGPPEPVSPGHLAARGSLVMTRPGLFHFVSDPGDFRRGGAALFGALKTGPLQARIGQRFAFEDAAAAHQALERGETLGASLLIP
jgi:NADPH:quinone reductase